MTRRNSGFSLIEMMISLAIAGIVLSAAYKLLVANQRFYRSQSVIADVESNVREAALILAGELREVSAAGGDLQLMTDTSITINAMRALGYLCRPPDFLLGGVTIKDAATFKYRAIDVTRDSVFIFREGTANTTTDDSWVRAKITSTAAQNCTDGSAGTYLRVNLPMAGGFTAAWLAGASLGGPVRTFETVNYRLYADASGTWYLGIRQWVNGAWTNTSAVAGPMRPNDGVKFTYYDNTGAVTATAANVAAIGIDVRGQSTSPIQVAGRATGVYNDSLTIRVAVRN